VHADYDRKARAPSSHSGRTKLVGILSIGDVVNWLMSALKAAIDNLERYSLAEIKDKE
jgi:hypothetical protein